ISPTNSVRLDGLRSGAWTISIAARSGGQVVQKSSEVNFRVTINPKPRPVIYSPVSGETAVAWDNFTIRWLNRSPTPKSEVVIKRMGDKGGVVSREIVYGRAETLTPKLPPGPYQISVRNLYDNMASEAGVVDVTTVEDAMGYHAKFFGVSAHATLGPTWGSTGFRSAAYGTDSVTNKNSSGELEMRLVADLTEEWGVDFGGGLRGDRFRDRRELSTLTDAYVMVDAVRLNTNAYLGVRHKLEPLGPSKPLWLRLALYWNQIEMPIAGTGNTFDVASTSEPRFVLTNARTWGSMLGGELRWGGYRSRWDAVGRVDLLVPIIGRGAVLATGGASPWWPGLEFRVTPRVKVSSDMRLGLTLGGRLQAVTLKESSGESSKYYSRRIFFMPNFSWDL
ncbi:MAG TPA: hypothetical protein VM901_02930, partial [Bdellovibrionota bacterium]|nr:hypothetical protein [Bdellovibrionota bacterium]